jgi:hypothetical protein
MSPERYRNDTASRRRPLIPNGHRRRARIGELLPRAPGRRGRRHASCRPSPAIPRGPRRSFPLQETSTPRPGPRPTTAIHRPWPENRAGDRSNGRLREPYSPPGTPSPPSRPARPSPTSPSTARAAATPGPGASRARPDPARARASAHQPPSRPGPMTTPVANPGLAPEDHRPQRPAKASAAPGPARTSRQLVLPTELAGACHRSRHFARGFTSAQLCCSQTGGCDWLALAIPRLAMGFRLARARTGSGGPRQGGSRRRDRTCPRWRPGRPGPGPRRCPRPRAAPSAAR